MDDRQRSDCARYRCARTNISTTHARQGLRYFRRVRTSDATIMTYQNGVLRQNFGTYDLVRGPYRIVSELSHDMTLEPGDIIACGSSLGVEPMRPGDVITIEITEIGVLQNLVI